MWFQNRRAKYRKQETQIQKAIPPAMHNQISNDMMRDLYKSSTQHHQRNYQYQYPAVINRYTAAQMTSMAAAAAAGSPYMAAQLSSIPNGPSNPTNHSFQDHMLHYQHY